MLQTHLNSEQLNSLSKNLIKNHSRNGFIAINRPDSAQLVDLHIYIIPKSVWKNVQHLAQNAAMDDAISVGFVRVSPDLRLFQMRKSIERLCGTENNFPRDFIFLRSVGRCLTRVKPIQENELKAKHFRPPLTYAPEIYLLEGRHEDYAYTPSTTPTMHTANYLFGSRYQYRLNLDDYNQSASRLSSSYRQSLVSSDRQQIPITAGFTLMQRIPSPNTLKWPKVIQANLEESSTNVSAPTTLRSRKTPSLYRELIKLQDEQDRLRQRQDELERIRLAAEQKKTKAERDEDKRRLRRQEKIAAERHRLEQETRAATKIQASYRGFKRRQEYRILQRSITDDATQVLSSKTNQSKKQWIEKKKKSDSSFDEFSDGSQILSISSSIKSASDADSNPYRTETSTIKRQNSQSLDSDSFSSSASCSSGSLTFKTERKIQSDKVCFSKTKEINNMDVDITRSATVTKVRYLAQELLSVSIPNITDETYDLQREEEARKRRQIQDEKRKQRELKENRSRKVVLPQKSEDAEMLRARLQEIRTEHMSLERMHNAVIRKLKHIHSRITLRRREARDMWKKKYFQEKKKTVPMEERTAQLRLELAQINSKLIQSIDNESKQLAQGGNARLAEMGSLKSQIIRVEHDIQSIRHQIDIAKLRLTTDIKLRNQAEIECRTLKSELIQAKMNHQQMKNQLS